MGLGIPLFFRTMTNYIKTYNPTCIALLETKCSSSRANDIFKKLGFNNFVCQDVQGTGGGGGGGIWFEWKPDRICIDSYSLHEHYINLFIDYNNYKWCFTIIYASPHANLRNLFWDTLSQVRPPDNVAWALIGDFNEVVDASEKCGECSL